ncbi:MAG: antibiotic biosynthesis monooxygenase [Pseudomonadales bacterium]
MYEPAAFPTTSGLSDPNTLMLFQEWENMESLLAHFQTDHMDEFMRGLPNVVSGEVVTRRYAVQSVDEEKQPGSGDTPTIH